LGESKRTIEAALKDPDRRLGFLQQAWNEMSMLGVWNLSRSDHAFIESRMKRLDEIIALVKQKEALYQPRTVSLPLEEHQLSLPLINHDPNSGLGARLAEPWKSWADPLLNDENIKDFLISPDPRALQGNIFDDAPLYAKSTYLLNALVTRSEGTDTKGFVLYFEATKKLGLHLKEAESAGISPLNSQDLERFSQLAERLSSVIEKSHTGARLSAHYLKSSEVLKASLALDRVRVSNPILAMILRKSKENIMTNTKRFVLGANSRLHNIVRQRKDYLKHHLLTENDYKNINEAIQIIDAAIQRKSGARLADTFGARLASERTVNSNEFTPDDLALLAQVHRSRRVQTPFHFGLSGPRVATLSSLNRITLSGPMPTLQILSPQAGGRLSAVSTMPLPALMSGAILDVKVVDSREMTNHDRVVEDALNRAPNVIAEAGPSYHRETPVQIWYHTKGRTLSASEMAGLKKMVQTVQNVAGGLVTLQIAANIADFSAAPEGTKIVLLGPLSEQLLAKGEALNAGMVALPSGLAENEKPVFAHFLFGVFVARLDKPVESLVHIWNNIRMDETADLTPVNFQRMHEVAKDWTLAWYTNLVARAQKVDWETVFSHTAMAVQRIIGSAA
jgi:hypothetical protein